MSRPGERVRLELGRKNEEGARDQPPRRADQQGEASTIDTANIVMFPRGKRGRPPQTFEQVETNVQSLRVYHIDEATRAVATTLFDNMKRAGIDVGGMNKDIALVIEAIRSLLSAHYGLHHPFQRLAAELFRSGYVELA